MTPQEIRDRIAASEEMQLFVSEGNHEAVAKLLSTQKQVMSNFMIGKGDVISTLGLTVGNAFLDVIDSNSNFRHVKHLLQEGRLLLNDSITLLAINSMVGSNISETVLFDQSHADALTSLAMVPDTVTHQEVTLAIRGQE